MKEKSFSDIRDKLREINIHDDVDIVVGIASGGIVPAYMVSHHLMKPLEFLWINFRDKENNPQHDSPVLLRPVQFDFKDKSILLVDDRATTGKTFAFAKAILKEARSIRTFSINGKSDYCLFDEDCFQLPWNV